MGIDPKLKQPGLVVHPIFLKQLHSVVRADRVFLNGDCLIYKQPHPLADLIQEGLVEDKAALGPNKQPWANRVFHRNSLHVFAACHIIKGLEHQKDRASLVGLDAGLVLCCDYVQGAVPVQCFIQLTELPVSADQQNIVFIFLLKVSGNGLISGPIGVGARSLAHSYGAQFGLFHKNSFLRSTRPDGLKDDGQISLYHRGHGKSTSQRNRKNHPPAGKAGG